MRFKPHHTRPQWKDLLTLNSDFIEKKGKRLLSRVFAGLIGSYSNYKIGVIVMMSIGILHSERCYEVNGIHLLFSHACSTLLFKRRYTSIKHSRVKSAKPSLLWESVNISPT